MGFLKGDAELAQVIAMVAGRNHICVVQHTRVLEHLENVAHIVVHTQQRPQAIAVVQVNPSFREIVHGQILCNTPVLAMPTRVVGRHTRHRLTGHWCISVPRSGLGGEVWRVRGQVREEGFGCRGAWWLSFEGLVFDTHNCS